MEDITLKRSAWGGPEFSTPYGHMCWNVLTLAIIDESGLPVTNHGEFSLSHSFGKPKYSLQYARVAIDTLLSFSLYLNHSELKASTQSTSNWGFWKNAYYYYPFVYILYITLIISFYSGSHS